ncbi:MAG: hypothetical protein IH856_12060, partial [Deltaproteobacteria bacterium]|nr:hypothetical protein [Deltaproteobacteria bacterium]
FVTHIGDKVVKVIDARTFEVVKTIAVGNGPVNTVFRPDGKYAYVTNMRDDTVSVIDLSELEVVKTLKVGKTPFGLLVIPAMDGQNF